MATDTFTFRHDFRRIWWSLVIRGTLALVLGLLILIKPLDSIAALALVIAIWALVAGITEIAHAFAVKPFFRSWWMLLLSGFVSTVFGIAAMYFYPVLSLTFAITWVSLWFGLTGILGISLALQQKRFDLPWAWSFLWGILSIFASVTVWFSPLATLAAIMGLIAGFAVVSGLILLIAAFRLKSLEHAVKPLVRPSPA